MPASPIPPWIESRILTFLNRAEGVADFEQIQDDPHDGKGPAIGQSAARKILDARNQLPGRRFRDIQQLLAIPGIGQDKLDDMAYTLGIPADKAFQSEMQGAILPENWNLAAYTTAIEHEEQFFQIAHQPSNLAVWVAEEVEQLVLARHENRLAAALAGELILQSYAETFDNPHYDTLALATWFYRFDADNWFRFEQIWPVCERYLNYFPEWNFRLELTFFKGFPMAGTLVDGICPNDLPVVVNFAEQTITLWNSELFD